MQDEAIVALYWARDEQAITESQRSYDTYLTKIAYNILQSDEDSKECVNDAYLAAWNSIPPQKPCVLSTYLGKLTRRISIDCFRKRTREKRRASEYALSLEELRDCVSGAPTPEAAYELGLLANAINAYLKTLPEEARDLFVGRYYFLDSLHEVAQYCAMSESKAKSILFRVRRGLREHLQKEGFDV